MFAIFWPMVIFVTVFLYALLILFLPFSTAWATVMLYSIISFWSRLPGVGTPSPFYVLYLTDLVDFFSLIIAINIGGIPAAIFTLLINLVSRACGVFPYWMAVFEDAVAQAIVCLIIPFIHVATGGNILVSMIWYTVLRLIINIPLYIVLPDPTPFPQFIVEVFVVGAALVAINAFYAQLFGKFFDNLLQSGIEFNWLLFLFVTIIIFAAKHAFFRKKHRIKKPSKIDKKIRGWANLQIYLIKHSHFMKRLRIIRK